MIDVLIGVAGAAIVLVVASDIFRSLLVPRANAKFLRLGPLLTLALFSGWQAIADRIANRALRQTMRASLAPLMLVLSLGIWAAMLIVGFGLFFWADRSQFSPGFRNVSDAIYAAGTAFSTLGMEGSVEGDFTRVAVLICSVTGLAIVTVVATFLISIQSGFGRRETLVLRLESHVALPPAGVEILETYAREGITKRLGGFFDAWENWAAEVAISHRAFPILILFRSNDSRCEWLAALGAVLDAAALIDAVIADPPTEAKAGAHFVLHTGTRVLNDIAKQFGLEAKESFESVDAGRFAEHRRLLARAGYTLVDDARAVDRFDERRRLYAPALMALGERLHIEITSP